MTAYRQKSFFSAITLFFFIALGMASVQSSALTAGKYRLKDNWNQHYLTTRSLNTYDSVTVASLVPEWLSMQWDVEAVSGDVFRLKNVWTGTYVNASNQNAWDESSIKMIPLNPDWGSMRWRAESAGNGLYRLKNEWTGLYLTSREFTWDTVRQAPVNTAWGSQMWRFESVDGGSSAPEPTPTPVPTPEPMPQTGGGDNTGALSNRDVANSIMHEVNGDVSLRSDGKISSVAFGGNSQNRAEMKIGEANFNDRFSYAFDLQLTRSSTPNNVVVTQIIGAPFNNKSIGIRTDQDGDFALEVSNSFLSSNSDGSNQQLTGRPLTFVKMGFNDGRQYNWRLEIDYRNGGSITVYKDGAVAAEVNGLDISNGQRRGDIRIGIYASNNPGRQTAIFDNVRLIGKSPIFR